MNYRNTLLEKYNQRKEKNRLYSLRAFARDLGLTSSRLSEILSGKTGLSVNKAVVIAQRLGIDGIEKDQFLDLVEAEHARSKVSRELARQRLTGKNQSDQEALTLEQLMQSKDCLAILTYLESNPSDMSVEGISRSCQLSVDATNRALINLSGMKLLDLTKVEYKG